MKEGKDMNLDKLVRPNQLGNGDVMRRSPRFKQTQISGHSNDNIHHQPLNLGQLTSSGTKRVLFPPEAISVFQEGLVGSAHGLQSHKSGNCLILSGILLYFNRRRNIKKRKSSF